MNLSIVMAILAAIIFAVFCALCIYTLKKNREESQRQERHMRAIENNLYRVGNIIEKNSEMIEQKLSRPEPAESEEDDFDFEIDLEDVAEEVAPVSETDATVQKEVLQTAISRRPVSKQQAAQKAVQQMQQPAQPQQTAQKTVQQIQQPAQPQQAAQKAVQQIQQPAQPQKAAQQVKPQSKPAADSITEIINGTKELEEKSPPKGKMSFDTGKSGKRYTAEELENLIR